MKRMIDDKIINKLSIKNDVLEIDGAVNADKITGNEIVENMSGYSIQQVTTTGYTIENIYAGAVKNGNKLTLVFAFNYTKDSSATNDSPYPIEFIVPSDIMSKLYPTEIGGNPVLDDKVIKGFSNLTNSIDIPCWLEKWTNSLAFQIYTTNMVVDTKYYIRYEVTFLLGDNLIP